MSHAIYAPSSADIWMNCHGMPEYVQSLGLKSGGHTLYTARGSVIHAMGEERLLDSTTDFVLNVRWDRWCDDLPAHLAEMPVTQHMIDQAHQYADAVEEMRQPGDVLHVEYRSVYSDILYGTADAVLVGDGNIVVADLKTGNHMVSPENNKQLLTYAMMSIDNLKLTPDSVSLSIIQPPNEAKPVRVWQTDMERITKHKTEVEHALASNELKSGDHCTWCPARNLCSSGMEVLDGMEMPSLFGKSGVSLF